MTSVRDDEGALEQAIADACLRADAGERLARNPRAFLESYGVAPEDVDAAIAGPGRLGIYRTLVRNGLATVTLRMLPLTRAHRNAGRDPGPFEADLAAFLDEVGPRTHYLRDVPHEFVAWVGMRWQTSSDAPPYLADLAQHELTSFAVGAAPASGTPLRPVEVALDRPLLFAESMRLECRAWAVHEVPPDGAPIAAPPRRETHLLAFRDADHAVRWLELTPLAAGIVARLARGEPLGTAVPAACSEHGAAPSMVLSDVARLLANLGARGVLLGGAG